MTQSNLKSGEQLPVRDTAMCALVDHDGTGVDHVEVSVEPAAPVAEPLRVTVVDGGKPQLRKKPQKTLRNLPLMIMAPHLPTPGGSKPGRTILGMKKTVDFD